MPQFLSIALAILAYALLSVGLVLMKKGINWIGFKGKKEAAFYRDLITWIAGFLLSNLYIVPNTIALKQLEPHIVAAMAGWGVVALVVLSHAILKEKLYRSDLLFTFIIFSAIILLNIFEHQEQKSGYSLPAIVIMASFPFLLFITGSLKFLSKRVRTIIFAGISGMATGMIIVTMKILVSRFGLHVPEYFSSPFLYLYLLFSLTAFISMQIAYKLGAMLRAGPVLYSAGIIYPLLCSGLIFSNRIHILQYFAVAAMIYGVFALLKKR